jgi:flagellar FliL protein
MSDLDTDLEPGADEALGDGDGEPIRKKKLSGKRLTLLVVLPLLLFGGGGAGAYFGGLLEPLLGSAEGGDDEREAKPALYYDLPELLVNLNSGGKRNSFLRLKVSLEIDDAGAVEQLDLVLPRIIDNFQVYLRELRLDDLSGSAGLFRLKEELLVRVNLAVKPVRINDVLFKEMIVQ